jgi:hypothetical protein
MSGYATAAVATEARARKSLLEQPFMGLLDLGVKAFEAGVKIGAWNLTRASREQKLSIERQFVRIPN